MHNAQNELRILPIVGKLQNGPSGGVGEGVGGVQIIYIHRYVCSICQMSCLGWIHQAFGVRKYLRLIRRHVAAIIVTKWRTPWARGRRSRGRAYAEANANRAGQTSSKLAHAKGPTAAALILAHINALKMHWIALAMQQEGGGGRVQQGYTVHCMNIIEVQRAEN